MGLVATAPSHDTTAPSGSFGVLPGVEVVQGLESVSVGGNRLHSCRPLYISFDYRRVGKFGLPSIQPTLVPRVEMGGALPRVGHVGVRLDFYVQMLSDQLRVFKNIL